MFDEVPAGLWFAGVLIVGAITWLVIWATNKGYSKRWDEE